MICTIAFILMFVVLFIQVIYLFKDPNRVDPFSHWLYIIIFTLLFIETVLRSIQIQFFAITNTFESLIFFSGVIILLLTIYKMKFKNKALPLILFTGTLMGILFLAIASSPIAPKTVKPPIPALRSMWLALHVSFAFIGEAFFTLAFLSSIYYLLTKNIKRKKLLDKMTYVSIAAGYPIYTIGALIFGAIWAEYAWGSFWSWDPKETWALITWMTYTLYLHTRIMKKWQGKRSAVISIVGYLFTLFTFFGVNFLLSGLHSYK
ncbi:MAG: cytochrome c biogenesis protein CcsA [bacterium]|nr:cytochrome c biogenesis protein CcsA [bacterium]